MLFNRPGPYGLQNRFSWVSPETYQINFQPRNPSRGQAVRSLIVAAMTLAMLVCGRPACASGILTVTPGSVSFGTVAVGTKSTQTVQLKNTGPTGLTITSATISGSGFTMNALSIPLALAASATVNLTVSFTPGSATALTGKITLNSNGSDNPWVTVSLSGSGSTSTRTLSLSSTSLSFGNELLGGSNTLQLTVKNNGNSSVLISQLSVSGTAFSTVGGLGGVTLAAGQSAYLLVVFAPKTTGFQTGTIAISSNAVNSPATVTMSGTGISSTTHSVVLSWAASSSSGVTGYNVYRSTTSGGGYARVNAVPTSTTKYSDGGVSSGATYYYVVTAVNSSGGESAKSGQISAKIP